MKFLLPILLLLTSCATPQTHRFKDHVLAIQKIRDSLLFDIQTGVSIIKIEFLGDILESTIQVKNTRLIKYLRKFGIKNIVRKEFVCTDVDFRTFLRKGGILSFELTSPKESFGIVYISKKDCPNLK